MEEEPIQEETVASEPIEKPVEELVEEPAEEPVEEAEALDDREENMREILELLEDNPNGLRMVELADIMGFDNWCSMIPIMRELLDNGEVRKEDSTYFAL